MKQAILPILLVCFFGSTAFSQGDSWKKIAPLPGCTARQYGIAFTIGDKGYYGTGVDSLGLDNNDMWVYDSTQDYWSQVSSVPVRASNTLYTFGRSGAAAFTIDDKAYIIGGYCNEISGYLKDVWQYSAAANTWVSKNNFPGAARAYAVAASANSKGYFGTGFNYVAGTGWTTLNDFWEYNPGTDGWLSKPALPVGRGKAAAFTILPAGAAANCVYVVGGNTAFGTTGYLNDCWKYDPVIFTWSQATSLPGNAREALVAFTVGSKAYAGLGNNLSGYLKDLYSFDGTATLNGTWSSETALTGGSGRSGSSAFVLNGSAYIVAGLSPGGYVSETWAYNATTRTWAEKKNADIGVRNGAAGFTIAGNGYVAGGFDGGISGADSRSSNDAFKYDPSAATWSRVQDFNGGSFVYSPSFVINDVAYLYIPNPNGDGRYQLWAYNTTTGAWSQKATQNYSCDQFFCISNLAYGVNITSDLLLQYNPANNGWAAKVGFPGLLQSGSSYRTGGIAFSINGKGYYGLGNAGTTYFDDLWEYDPLSANLWAQKAAFGGGVRSHAASFSIGDYGYVGSGSSASTYGTTDFWRYNAAADTWARVADIIAGPRQLTAAFVINNKAYVGSGDDDYLGSGNNPAGTHKDFYEYTPASSTLPVSLLNLTAARQGHDVLLTWQTAQEINSSYFNIQRSANGQQFTTIGTVKAAGSSTALLTYKYNDASLLKWPSGKVYYRIQEADKDGKNTLSAVAGVIIQGSTALSIYPNPVKDIAYIQGNGIKTIIVIDNTGREVLKQNAAGNNLYSLNVSALVAGTYVIKTLDGTGNIETTTMIKQ